MAEVATVDNRCILPTCSQSGPIKTFKEEAIKNVKKCLFCGNACEQAIKPLTSR